MKHILSAIVFYKLQTQFGMHRNEFSEVGPFSNREDCGNSVMGTAAVLAMCGERGGQEAEAGADNGDDCPASNCF